MKGLNGLTSRQSWRLILKNCGRSMKWKEPAANRMLLVMIKVRTNTFFMIVQRKVLKVAEVFVTIVKDWSQALHRLQNVAMDTASGAQASSDIRELGRALFCDRRYGHVFVYHNSASSYYGARGFRGSLRVCMLHSQLNLNLRTDHLGKG